ncbi:MAG: L-glutamate gamma-semialdehyde dehydrogenase [Clostridia bacterium]|nr:L-glutamate gamma-semialdehyde dehydrogenase [Clostridia bacterium]
MNNAFFTVPKPYNEPILSYMPGSPERQALKDELARQSAEVVTIPLIIGGKEVYTEVFADVRAPHDHGHVLARYCVATEKELRLAIDAALDAKAQWAAMPFEHRAAIFLKAADMLAGPLRAKINAATMLGQSKTVFQAEIDSACELCDFFRFNAYFASQIYGEQPLNSKGVWNRLEYRPLDGFVVAISPFNFTSIGGNLPSAPALMGNTVLWKPSSTAVLSNYYVMRLLMDAGLPAGVINFIPSRGREVSEHVLTHPMLAGFHFTGSTEVFSGVFTTVGNNIRNYHSYPRLVGETGGKDFIFAHSSADVEALSAAMVRGAFEYQGQKCSAASRAFIPASLWEAVRARTVAIMETLKVGDVCDFTTFMGAVIDEKSFDFIAGHIDMARESQDAELICGGYDSSKGYFIQPTLIRAYKPDFPTMVTELFGPVLTVYVYDDADFDATLELCDKATAYALTGAIFARDRQVIAHMERALADCAGNFYINDKPTGAVVGQQPFGGARASGTNDKAGSALNLYRWLSPRTIKESFVSPTDITYPYMCRE